MTWTVYVEIMTKALYSMSLVYPGHVRLIIFNVVFICTCRVTCCFPAASNEMIICPGKVGLRCGVHLRCHWMSTTSFEL